MLQLEGFSKFDDDSVERVKIIAIVTAVTGKVHYRQDFLFSVGIQSLIHLPIHQNRLDSATWLRLKDQGSIGMAIILNPAGYFVDIFLLAREKLLLLVMLHGTFTQTEINRKITQCSWYIVRRGFFSRYGWFQQAYRLLYVRNCFIFLNFPLIFI